MSRSGRKWRDPFALDARERKAGPHDQTKRKQIEELTREELEEEIENSLYDEQEWIETKLPE